jgi:hypothetical protein
MIIDTIVTRSTVYKSEVVDISSTIEVDGPVIAWADANPIVWKIVMGTKSRAFGKYSSEYLGYQRGDDAQTVVARVTHFRMLVDGEGFAASRPSEFWRWRAQFVMDHYNDKGFTSDYFR